MRGKHWISAMSEYWALMPERGPAYLELVLQHMKGPDALSNTRPEDFSSVHSGLIGISLAARPYAISEFGLDIPVAAAPENSVSIITLGNIITKYDGWCHAGIETKASLLQEADANPNIIGHILIFDTPGGEARAPEKMAQVINACTKPVFGLVDNLCASAGYWIACNCDKLFIAGNMAQVGSIGAYTTIIDHTKRLEAMGINLIEIYAEQSINKNIEFREALEGKPEKMVARLTELQNLFEAAVKSKRGDLITDESVFTGTVLLGQKSVEAGLVDGFATLTELVEMVAQEAQSRELLNTTTYH